MTHTTIITPTIGTDYLHKCCQSVASQSSPALHLLIPDGQEHEDKVYEVAMSVYEENPATYNFAMMSLPWNTGADGVNGHRAYAAGSNIVITPFFSFLDEDNWIAHDWTLKMQNALDRHEKAMYATCRRTVTTIDEQIIGLDNKESIGKNDMGYLLYDTNTFMFKRQMALLTPYMALRYYKEAPNKSLGDRDLTNTIYSIEHVHLDHYHGTFYRSPERLTQFFEEICDAE